MRTIALEEHFWTPALASPPGTGVLALLGEDLDAQLRDLGEGRLAGMDAAGALWEMTCMSMPAASMSRMRPVPTSLSRALTG